MKKLTEESKSEESREIIYIEPDNMTKRNNYITLSTNLSIKSLYELIMKKPNIVNVIDENGETFLSYAIKRKNINVINLILASPILNLNFQDKRGNTYLHLAILYQNINLIETLLIKGINPNVQNKDGDTALHLAYLINDNDIINLLINNDVDFNLKNLQGYIAEELRPNSDSKNHINIFDEKNNLINEVDINWKNINNIQLVKEYGKILIYLSNEIEKRPMSFNEKNNIKKSFNYNIDDNTMNNINRSTEPKSDSTNLKEKKNNIENNNNNTYRPGIFKLTSKLSLAPRNSYNSIKSNDKDSNYLSDSQENNSNLKESKKFDNKKINKDIVPNTQLCNDDDLINFIKVEPRDNFFKHKTSDSLFNDNDLTEIKNYVKKDDVINSFVNVSAIGYKYDTEKSPTTNLKTELEKLKNLNKHYNSKTHVNNENYNSPFRDFNNLKDYNNRSNILPKITENNEQDNLIYEPKIKNNIYKDMSVISNIVNNHDNISNNNISNISGIMNLNKYNNFTENSNTYFSNLNINDTTNNIIHKYNINTNDLNDLTENNGGIDINEKLENKIFDEENGNYFNNISMIKNDKDERKISFITRESIKNLNNDKDKTSFINSHINKPLIEFLLQINMQKYYNNLNSNGFDDINFIIEQTKEGLAITDIQLKQAGIDKPGDRAKILIRIQEKANNFEYSLPKSVYYISNNLDNLDQKTNDFNICIFNSWLKNIKMEMYLKNFVTNGYYSIDLLFMQTLSKNPLDDNILKEIGIDKLGHRARILNKLKEESKAYNIKLRSSVITLNSQENSKMCGDCIVI